MKTKLFSIIKCNDLQGFIKEAQTKLSDSDLWAFRGQKEAKWSLKTSFERECIRLHVPINKRKPVELNMIREFQRRLHQYTSNVPNSKTNDEWLAIMQHYGAPTRLIDFSYSPYVASYFAFEKAEPRSYVAIWAINCTWLLEQLQNMDKTLYAEYRKYLECREEPEHFNNVFIPGYSPNSVKTCKSHRFILSVNPFRLNERLTYQMGVFLSPGDVTVGFMTNLSIYATNRDIQDNVIQYKIYTDKNNENTINALKILHDMNVNSITLFPDLIGFAQSFAPRIHPLFIHQREY
jgi:hypothetical protein